MKIKNSLVKNIGFVLILLMGTSGYAQTSEKYDSRYQRYYQAEDLFEKAKFSAAHEEFEAFMLEFQDVNDPLYVKAKYYMALSALHLYHTDAERLLLDFLKEYPESIHRQTVYMELGNFYYRKKKYEETIQWLSRIDIYDLTEDQKQEYYFKLGYAHFQEDELKKARDAFYEIINIEGQYQSPAIYYYSHIAYTEKSYQTALEGFTRLKDDPNFKKVVPYYIAQIYYLQGKYEKLLEYAPDKVEDADPKNAIGLAHLIGDAYYRVGKYDEAVPFLEEYNNKSATTRDEDYQLGYAYYKSGAYDRAIPLFAKVAKKEDKLAQTALYHIGECYLKQEEYFYARNAFEQASTMPYDAEIEEDALYHYAVLSYKLDYNPFDEAVEAMNLYLERYPKSRRTQDIYQYLVNVYTTMKNYKSAVDAIDRIEDKDFKMKNAYQIMAYNYGVEQFENGNMSAAIEAFKLVKRFPIDPKLNSMSLYWTAEALYKSAKFSEAIVAYRSFLDEPGSYNLPQHTDAYYNIAYCYFKQKDYLSAIQSFRSYTQATDGSDKQRLTDAYLRIGDAYYMYRPDKDSRPDDNQAVLFYQKAIETGGGQLDYAKYQMGLSYGYLRKYTEKASIMLDLVNNHSKSVLAVPALYEAAESYRLMLDEEDPSHKEKALRYYNQLIQDHPSHSKVVDAIYQIGSIYFIDNKYEQAEKQYLKVINEYTGSHLEIAALGRLEDIYTALNQPEKYFELLNKIGRDIDQGKQDSIMFTAAFRQYSDSVFDVAAASFKKYLAKFARPNSEIEALYYMGDSYGEIENEVEQVAAFKKLLSKSNNRFTERAADLVSAYEYKQKNYTLAAEYYEKLENVASYPESKLRANIGLMRCYTFENELAAAKIYALRVKDNDQALDNVKIEAHYVVGKAELESNNYEVALEEFEFVKEQTSSALGAEAHYNIALIYHLQEEYKKSEEVVRAVMKKWTGYDYWMAKVLILQAKNSIGMDDYVQAEFTINSVLKGYVIEDDGILDEANLVMDVITEYKNKEKDLGPEIDNTIEIGNGE
jgi:tetratricopeptide (TPR) repeat protein